MMDIFGLLQGYEGYSGIFEGYEEYFKVAEDISGLN